METCKSVGNHDITLLKCTSSYPAPVEEANLVMMQRFAKDFGVKVGLSDHTLGMVVPVVSVALGATVIEKHFILDRSIGGPDAAFSLDEKEFTEMVTAVRQAERAIGTEDYTTTQSQRKGRQFSRSLYVVRDIKKRETFTRGKRTVHPSGLWFTS